MAALGTPPDIQNSSIDPACLAPDLAANSIAVGLQSSFIWGVDAAERLLNIGLYTVPEAARLTRVSAGKIRRWLKGYDFKSGDRVHHSNAVWQGELQPVENKLALSFRDLLELRFVDAFIRTGVSWRTMRRAHAR
ncbi:MAG TPA: hypothetical protein VH207_08500, partial [Chthoniobacterales bacterium]|nr:hypothetical protein [Chthoniobacterales bacterium]